MFNYEVVDNIQSLIKAEWNIVRTCQQMLLPDFSDKILPPEFCGVLFYEDYAFASSGHFILKIKLEESYTSIPYFFDFNLDDVIEGYNPFGDSIESIRDTVGQWRNFNVKISPQEFLSMSDANVAILRERRLYAMHGSLKVKDLELSFNTKGDKLPAFQSLLPCKPSGGFPNFSVSLTYFYKVMEIVAPYYGLVELCTNDNYSELLIKAKNKYAPGRPDIRCLLGNFMV